MQLHFQRKRDAERAAREAAGESFWTSKFDNNVRVRILHSFRDAVGEVSLHYELARGLLLRRAGLLYLCQPNTNPVDDLLDYLLHCSDDMVPSVLEVMSHVCNNQSIKQRTNNWDSDVFDPLVNSILREHRISYELVNSQMIEFSSKEIHQVVVVPVLQLLAGRPDLAKVESAYQDALKEISKGAPSDAITDAGTALQEMLQALGCIGNSLGPLIRSARENGFLARHDSPMLGAVLKVLDWVSADRSERGDAHEVSEASIDDAWFTVHIVGVAILRLSKATPR
jgi:hypothetical protein